MERSSRALGLSFAHLNLRRNPFGALRPEERPALAVVEVERFVAPLASGRFAVQFLGDRGFGKSTHLFALRAHFPGAPYLHVAEGQRPRAFPEGAPLFLDESQRVPRRSLRGLFLQPRPLVLGTHRDHREALERAGRRVETVYVGAVFDRDRLDRICRRRIEAFRRGPGALPRVPEEALETLITRHGCNVRAIEDDLYDAFEGQERIGDVEV